MAAAPHFCTNCGRVVPAGAAFCPNCRTPQPGAPAGAVAPPPPPGYQAYAQQAAAYPQPSPYAYQYPMAPRAQVPGASPARLNPLVLGGALGGILLLAIFVVTAIGLASNTPPPPRCTINCGPQVKTPLQAQKTFRSSNLRYEADYPETWRVDSENADGAVLKTQAAQFIIRGRRGGTEEQMTRDLLSGLNSSSWQGITPIQDLTGAHVGYQDGRGMVFAANFVPQSGQAVRARIVVITASRNGLTVGMLGINPYIKDAPNGIPESPSFDFVLSQFRWPA